MTNDSTFWTKQQDDGKALVGVLKNASNQAIDLTLATSVLLTVKRDSTKIIDGEAMTIANQTTTRGGVSYSATKSQLANAGTYKAECKIVWQDGSWTHVPAGDGESKYFSFIIDEVL